MLKQKSKLLFAAILFASVAFVSCNNDADKKAEAPAADSTKMQSTDKKMEPAKPDTASKPAAMDTTVGSTKPIVPGK